MRRTCFTASALLIASLALLPPARAQYSATNTDNIPGTVSPPPPLAGHLTTDPPVVADFNKDGHPDAAVVGLQGLQVGFQILLGNGDGYFVPQASVAAGTDFCAESYDCAFSPTRIFTGDFNGDGNPDILFYYSVWQSPNSTVIVPYAHLYLGKGDGTFQAPIDISKYVGNSSMIVADLRGDGKLDLISQNLQSAANYNYDPVRVALGNGDGTFDDAIAWGEAGTTLDNHTLIAADFGRGKVDILYELDDAGSYEVLPGNGDGTFGAAEVHTFDPNHRLAGVLLGHFKRNAPPGMVAWSQQVCCSIGVAGGNGDGTFQAFQDYPLTMNGISVGANSTVVSDINGDGIDDLVFQWMPQNSYAYIGWMLGKGDGTFGSLTALEDTSAYITSESPLLAADLTRHGHQDLFLPSDTSSALFNTADTQVGTTTKLTTPSHASFFPNKESFTVTVTGNAPPKIAGVTYPPGAVSLYNNGKLLGSRPVLSGVATFDDWILPIGTYNLVAVYQGDSVYFSSSSGYTPPFNVIGATSTTALSVSGSNPAYFSDPVTLQATVTGQITLDGKTMYPTGPVSFYSSERLLGTRGLVNGKATFVASALPIGNSALRVDYEGSSQFFWSYSTQVIYTVQGIPTSISLVSNANPSSLGASVTFRATISRATAPDTAEPNGYLHFYDGTTELGAGRIQSGVASFSTSALAAGTHTITAQYPSGSSAFAPSTSNIVTEKVN